MQYKRIIGMITALAAAVYCTAPAASAAESIEENAAVVTEIQQTSVYDEYREWSQLDSRWGDTPMGSTTIRKSGCLITSIAIMAMHSGSLDTTALSNMGISDIEQFNPAVLANAYTAADGFTYGGAIKSWGTLNTIIPSITFGADKYFQSTEKTAVAQELNALMSEGWHIVARVNNGGFHWVYIESVGEDGSITMCDPAFDTHNLYEAYPGGLQGEYWMLKGTNPPASTPAERVEGVEIEISAMPERLSFICGEMPDLSGGVITLNGYDKEKGSWSETIDMADSERVSVDMSAYNADVDGEYEIIATVDCGEEKKSVSFTVTVSSGTGEFYVDSDMPVAVCSEQGSGSVQYSLVRGNVINITERDGVYGKLASQEISGWIDMRLLEKIENHLHEKGDINNDGVIDKYDLSLLNTYLQQREKLPNGVSVLTAAQIYSADMNCDGINDLQDVREYLMIV